MSNLKCESFNKLIDTNYIQLYKHTSNKNDKTEELCHSGKLFNQYIIYLIEKNNLKK
jgi:hypothetical protein